jgi:thiosulfate/3-mercaptopyruvate sulfurtransferase
MQHFVEVDWLAAHIDDPSVAIVDTRSMPLTVYYVSLGREQYLAGHIPGAVHLDYATDLDDPETWYAARVAPPARFAEVVGNAGIGDATTVIAYDAGEAQYAGRLIWMLRYYGHDDAAILAGGIDAWTASGLPRETEIPSPDPQRFTPRPRPRIRASRDEVLDIVEGRSDGQLLCVASDAAYATRDREIAGARRLSCSLLFDETNDGRLRGAERLREVTTDLDPQKRTITYCGNGVSAAGAYFALLSAGFTDVGVYDGSWSEWSHYGLPTVPKLETERPVR